MWVLVFGVAFGVPVGLVLITLLCIHIRNPYFRPEEYQIPEGPQNRPFNKTLAVGTHNSCHVSNLFSGWPCFPPYWGPAHWRYTHPAMVRQLTQGVRHLEIDAWFETNLREWHVFHHFPDPISNGPPLLSQQLQEIAAWARANPAVAPTWISLDIKGCYSGMCGLPVKFSSLDNEDPNVGFEALQVADTAVKHNFGDLAVCVGELRRGDTCIQTGVKKHGWPTAKSLAGRFFFTVAESCWRADDDTSVLLKKGRFNNGVFDPQTVFFEAGEPEKAIQIVQEGYICRSLLFIHDSDHVNVDQGRFGDLLHAGVQFIATNCMRRVLDSDEYNNRVATMQ